MSMDATDPTLAQSQTSHIGANDQELTAGTVVGEYHIEDKIGEGGFGTVYKAVHPLIGKVAAVKVLSRQYSAQPEMVSRFVAEARAVNQIQNRHIIDIFSFGRLEDGRHYYLMEYLDGLPLERYIAQCGRVSLADTVPILRGVAKALDAAHAKGIAHRDLKPDNVFLVKNDDGTLMPKLLDFGIAKLLSDDDQSMHKTKTGAPIGTPYYMSPEQCRGRDVDHRTDIYAFGVVAYKMLTGQLPFEGDEYMTILMRQISDDAAAPSSLVPELPTGVDETIAWMMKKAPSERPPNLITAVRSLEQAATAAGIALPLAPAPSGVYAARTSPLSHQSTPSNITPMSERAMATPGASLSNSGAAVRPSDISLAATAAPGMPVDVDHAANVGDASDIRPADWARNKSKPPVLLLGLIGALVIGAGIYMLGFASSDDDNDTAVPAQTTSTAPNSEQPDNTDDTGRRDRRGRRELITLDIQGPPVGTEVYSLRGLIGTAPGKIQLPQREQTVILTFKASGYITTSIEVVPSEDRTLAVELVAQPGTADTATADEQPPQTTDTESPGKTGSGKTGSGKTSSGKTGSGKTGSGKTGSGKTGSGKTGSGKTGSGDISDRDTIEDPFK